MQRGSVRLSEKSELFRKYEGKKIALYGLGVETKRELHLLENRFKIVGLLDSFKEDGEIYGKKIISLMQAVQLQVKLIIVIARPGSCRAIAKRIGDVCKEHGIILMDIRGKDLLERRQIIYDFECVNGSTKAELYQQIDTAEVISFDLFDTLIMRDVWYSSDIIELMSEVLKTKGIHINDFISKRMEAEKRLSVNGAPTLKVIYEDILGQIGRCSVSAIELAEMEWTIDFETIMARRAVCEVYKYCIGEKKAVYIVTDTYYSEEQIKKILRKYNLRGYTALLVSCECGTGKRGRLFDQLKEKEGKKRYLHIGDDPIADIEMAIKKGINTYRIFSGEELFDAVGNMGIKAYRNSLAERLKIGMFISKLFNDPFQFETKERKIELQNAYDIGYLICAPIITDFVLWFHEKVQQYKINNIWFGARDGYLLKKMYKKLDENANTAYFHTSRMAAIRAGMMEEEDITYVDSMRFSGTIEENLKVRFGLEVDGINGEWNTNVEMQVVKENSLLNYKDVILEQAMKERKKYIKYIQKHNLGKGDIAFFDFVAKGTTQMYVERFVAHHLKGLYFLRLEQDFMNDKYMDIEAYYDLEEADKNSIYDNYYILETILTAPHPCLWGFDDAGEPMYVKETRKAEDIKCIMQVQEGILDYFCRYLELLPVNIEKQSKKMDEEILRLIHNLKIRDREFLALIVEDPFFNRMTGVKDLI